MLAQRKEPISWQVRLGFLFHRVSNPLVRTVLSSPLHPLLSDKLILITYLGRQSRLRHTLPVMYANCNGELVVVVGYYQRKKWWLNLRGEPAAVKVRYRGKLLDCSAIAIEGDAKMIAPRLAEYLKKYPASARRRGLGTTSDINEKALSDKAKSEVMVAIRPRALAQSSSLSTQEKGAKM